ncbi:MAG: Verru_Chthon cassette protein D [Verrucomicrobiales bacterium]|nr:Verru_Chthon cassette protein D [Verrucomicrobiales bacterium]MCP5558372.1 Verru_Chthon cassette protein D [Verrucomicrobiaceae bacterium]
MITQPNHPSPTPQALRQAGFSLVEMLTVVTVLAIMLAATTQISRSWTGQEIAASATRIAQDFSYAQSLAMKRGQPVEVRFYKHYDQSIASDEPHYHSYQLVGYDSRQQRIITLGEMQRLEGSIVVIPSTRYSTVMLTERSFDFTKDPLPGIVTSGMKVASVEFRPSGATSLDPDPNHQWTLSLAAEKDSRPSGKLPPTARTLLITPETGAVTVY